MKRPQQIHKTVWNDLIGPPLLIHVSCVVKRPQGVVSSLHWNHLKPAFRKIAQSRY
jgi:hypothetical protein